MAEHIVSADVNDAFLEAVMSLSDKLKYLQQETPASDGSSLDIPPSETFAGRSLLPDLEKLKLKAITKARDYFLLQFQAIRKPKTNVQMVQQNSLCKYAPLLQFVQREAPSAAEDLRYNSIVKLYSVSTLNEENRGFCADFVYKTADFVSLADFLISLPLHLSISLSLLS